LYGVSYAIEAQTVKDNLDISQNGPFQTATFELDLEMEAIGKSDFAIELSNDKNQKVLIGYKANEDKYYIDRSEAGNHAFSDSFGAIQDRKSTRLNSSHVKISYAVFCLKKKRQ